jgi:hypothetical protein
VLVLICKESTSFSSTFSGPVAQLVEHRTFNAVVAGSSPARLTIFNNLANALVVTEHRITFPHVL